MPRRRPLVIGHRGAPGYRPEHTRSSYDLALALGVDAVEPDVVWTRDGVAVVRHENEISGTTDVADRPEFADRRTTKVIDGTSLTVNEVEGNFFGVNIIPHTQAVTTWGTMKVGQRVNLEIDMLARYVARLTEYKAS